MFPDNAFPSKVILSFHLHSTVHLPFFSLSTDEDRRFTCLGCEEISVVLLDVDSVRSQGCQPISGLCRIY